MLKPNSGFIRIGNTTRITSYNVCYTKLLRSLDDDSSRKPNLDMNIIRQIAEKTGLRFTPEKENAENTFAPIDLLDYIYAVLHSPAYREKYSRITSYNVCYTKLLRADSGKGRMYGRMFRIR